MKTIKLILTASILVFCLTAFSQRQQIGTSNTYWELVKTGNDTTLQITGSGDMPDFTLSFGEVSTPWFDTRTTIKQLDIGDSITKIGNYTFFDCSRLIGNIDIPTGLTAIGDAAFYSCKSITSIYLPNAVISIGDYAFNDCSSLSLVNIPEGIASIGNFTFWGCSSLISMIIPENITSIGNNAFANCSNLISVTLPSNLTNIGNVVFLSCVKLNTIINLNPTPVDIQDNVFYGVDTNTCSLKVLEGSINLYREAPVWKSFLITEYVDVPVLQTLSNDIILYPNPANNSIYIQSEKDTTIEQIRIFDINGKQIKQINHCEQFIDISYLAKGIYFFKIKTKEGEILKKIAKE